MLREGKGHELAMAFDVGERRNSSRPKKSWKTARNLNAKFKFEFRAKFKFLIWISRSLESASQGRKTKRQHAKFNAMDYELINGL
jgi:hypothetical protein